MPWYWGQGRRAAAAGRRAGGVPVANGGSFFSRNATSGRAGWLPRTVSVALARFLLSATRLQASVAQEGAATWKPALGSVPCLNRRSPRALGFKIKCDHRAGPRPRLHRASVSYWAASIFSRARCVLIYINKRWAVGASELAFVSQIVPLSSPAGYSSAWCPPQPSLP